MEKEKVLLIVPHEDDDILVGGNQLLYYASKTQYNVFVVFVTNGDLNEFDGIIRLNEAIKCLSSLGIDESHIIFLGYKDTCLINGIHLYNSVENSSYTTYALPNHPELHYIKNHNHSCCSRSAIKSDLKDLIIEISPHIVISVDADLHPDHRMVSFLFDEIMGELLKDKPSYKPSVYKKFAYNGTWLGERDYFTSNANATILDTTELIPYHVNDIKRFSFGTLRRDYNIFSEPVFKLMRNYKSQKATIYADRYINSDSIYIIRETENFALSAKINVSSGDARFINDFKIIDSSDVRIQPLLVDNCAWFAEEDDDRKTIWMSWSEIKEIKGISIYCWSNQAHTNSSIKVYNDNKFVFEIKPKDGAVRCYRHLFPDILLSRGLEFCVHCVENEKVYVSEIEVNPPCNRDYPESKGVTERKAGLTRYFYQLIFKVYSYLGERLQSRYDYCRKLNCEEFPGTIRLILYNINIFVEKIRKKVIK